MASEEGKRRISSDVESMMLELGKLDPSQLSGRFYIIEYFVRTPKDLNLILLKKILILLE